MRLLTTSLLLLGGCYTESDFIPAKTTAFCQVLLECTDPAVLAFDGVDAQSCEGVWGPRFQAEAQGCKVKGSAGKQCVSALETMACPTDGRPVQDHIPVVCASALQKCPAPPPVDGQQRTTDTGA